MLGKDLERYSNGLWKKAVATILVNPNFHCICLYRLSSWLYKYHLEILAKLIWYVNRLLFHVDIDYRCKLSGGLKIIHGLGLVVGHEVVSEGRLTLYQHVTLGGTNGQYAEIKGIYTGQPYIEKDVIIYTGASVFGPVHIKEGTIIKAGSLLNTRSNRKDDT